MQKNRFGRRLLSQAAVGLTLWTCAQPGIAQDIPGHTLLADDQVAVVERPFSFLRAPWAVTSSGQAVFSTSDYRIGSTSEHALWKSGGGGVTPILRLNAPAPGGGLFRELNTSSQSSHSMFTTEGYGVFLAGYRLPDDDTTIKGLFLHEPNGQLHKVAFEGQTADGGGVYNSGFPGHYAISPRGKIVFASSLTGSSTYGIYYARLVANTVVVTRIVGHNDPAPDSLGNFDLAGNFKPECVIDDSGRVYFKARTTGNAQGQLFYWDGSTIQVVQDSSGLNSFCMNNMGQCVFTTSQRIGLATLGVTSTLLNSSTPLPGGGTLSTSSSKLQINDAGEVVFTSYGIFHWSEGVVTSIALAGQAAPDGGTFDSGFFGFSPWRGPFLTQSGLVVFGVQVSGQNRTYMAYQGVLAPMVALGDRVDGGYIRQLNLHDKSSPFGGQGPINEQGMLAYHADLASTPTGDANRRGVFLYVSPSRWSSQVNGAWDDAENWRFGFAPLPQREVIIDPATTLNITGPSPVGGTETVKVLIVGGGAGVARLELQAGSRLVGSERIEIRPNGVLGGSGGVSGALLMDGRQEIGPETIDMPLGASTYSNRSRLDVALDHPTDILQGMMASALTIEAGARVNVILNRATSTVDLTNSPWQGLLRWNLFKSATITGNFVVDNVSLDSQGTAATEALGAFSIEQKNGKVDLVWKPKQYQPTVVRAEDQLVVVGQKVQLKTTATGNLLSYRWTRNGKVMPTQNADTLTFESVALNDAATYDVRVSNDVGFVTTAPGTRVGVVEVNLPDTQAAMAGTLQLTVKSASPSGTPLGFQWFHAGQPLSNGINATGGVVSGVNSKTLQITKMSDSEEGAYFCRVFMDSLEIDTLECTVHVVVKPTISLAAPNLLAMVGAPYEWQLAADELPTRFAISGLPSGLVYNTQSGLVSGIPLKAGSYPVKAKASNKAGTGPVQTFVLEVAPLPPGTVGSFSVLFDRHSELNQNLGGFAQLTVASTGSVTGTLQWGKLKFPIRKRLVSSLSSNPVLSSSFNHPVLGPLTLMLTFDGSANLVSGSVNAPSLAICSGEGYRLFWGKKGAESFAGSYTMVSEFPGSYQDDGLQPLGVGWQTSKISFSGSVTSSGQTPDGIAYTHSGKLWPDGTLPEFVLLYKGTGSLTSKVRCLLGDIPNDHRLVGWMEHYKAGNQNDRSYSQGIPILRRTVDGAAWLKPTSQQPIVFDLADPGPGNTNASINFTGANVETAAQFANLAQSFRINTRNTSLFATATTGNPCKVALKIGPATGHFSGSFALTDVDRGIVLPRKVAFKGVLLQHRREGTGCFQLPGLQPNLAQSPVLSGAVQWR
jgi:hypothetical protein